MVSVQSKNPFDVLAAAGDIADGSLPPAATAALPSAGNKAAAQPRETQKKENRPSRVGNEYPPRGGGATRAGNYKASNPEGDARPQFSGDRTPRDDGFRQSHRSRMDRPYNARGGRGGRVYDRHSGGHRDSEMKANQGWGNPVENPEENAATVTDGADAWAAPADQGAPADQAAPTDDAWAAPADEGAPADVWAAPADEAAPADAWAAPAASENPWDASGEKGGAAPANEAPEDPEAAARAENLRRQREEEEKQKTLDEYMAEKANIPRLALPEVRKANEGTDAAQWKEAVVLKRTEEEELFAIKSAGKGKGRKERQGKVTLDIEQRFAPRPRPERGSNDRREQGGFRNGQGSGRGRGFEGRAGPPAGNRSLNVGDEAAFPTLRS